MWTIQSITQQSKYDNMSNNIVTEMLASDETITSSFEIMRQFGQFGQFKETRGKAIFTAIVNAIHAKKIDCTVKKSYSIVFPYMEIIPSLWNNHLIALTNDPGLFLGIKRRNADEPAISSDQIIYYMDGFKEYPVWLCSREYTKPPFRLNTAEPWLYSNEQQVVNELVQTIEYFISISIKEPKLP